MGQIADVGPLALDGLLVVQNQRIELLGQRLQFGRIGFLYAIRLAPAHGGHLTLQAKQWAQAYAHLRDDCGSQSTPQHQEGQGGCSNKIPDIAINRRAVLSGQKHRLVAVDGRNTRDAAQMFVRLRADGVEGDQPSRRLAHSLQKIGGRAKFSVPERTGSRRRPG